jgi:glycosyltransferase involved in cell wall biosynthesis
MKIKTFAWRNNQLDQITRIEQGLINLGHEIVQENPDLIYCNNDFFDEPIKYAQDYPNALVIFNILDLQLDNPLYDLNKLRNQLFQSDYITCISKTVQNQIEENLQLESHIIYNPVKDIYHMPEIEKSFPFFYVGRARCQNKRYNLIQETFQISNWPSDLIRVCGPEPPTFGMYGGIVSDEDLNILYNQAGITLLPSKFEGLGLTAIESLICGTPVIECSDNPTAYELIPSCMVCDPTPTSLIIKIKEINDNYEFFRSLALEYGEKYKVQFNKNTIAQNILNLI